jgi:serine/threonine protein kinase
MPGLEGTTLGRYHLLRRLGRGGMSEVYLAHDELMDREVAVKVVNSNHADYVERFRREVQAIANLSHKHILPAFDTGEHDYWYYLVMPYIEQGTLRDRLEQGPLTLEEAGEILQQVASALQFAHDHGIIHRDIKASNILLRDDHYAYLADFGLVKTLKGASELTQTGSLLGTPEYMAPELAEGPASTSSDIYALGVLLYQMVTGRVPFTGETPLAVYWKQMREQPIPPSRLNPAIPRAVEEVILRALDKDPRRRFKTAQALAYAYMQALIVPDSNETEVMPPLEEKVVPSLPSSPAQVQKQPGKLILPGYPPESPPLQSLGALRQSPQTMPKPLAPSPRPTYIPPATLAGRTVARRRRRRRIQRLLITVFMALGLLLIITALVLLALSSNTRTQRPVNATATAGANATNAAQAVNATQQANATATQQAKSSAGKATATAEAKATQQAHAAATATAQAKGVQATATAAVVVTATSGTPTLADALSSNTNGRWTENETCVFKSESYHVLVQQAGSLQLCGAANPNDPSLTVNNATIEVDVTLLSGNDVGLVFRANGDQFYDFEINNQGQFFFRRHDAGAGSNYVSLIKATKSDAIKPVGQKNTLVVIANGNDFKLYVNGVFVGEKQDSTYSSGQVAFVTGTLAPTTSGEGSFANLKIFKIV